MNDQTYNMIKMALASDPSVTGAQRQTILDLCLGQETKKAKPTKYLTRKEAAEKYGTPGNYMNGANIAGFVKVVESMMDQGLV